MPFQRTPPRMRLLVVEDNPSISENLVEIFENEFEVDVASDGKSALVASDRGFDLAILDVRLPDMSGNVLLKMLKESNPGSEIIVHTGNADLESAIAAIRGDAYAYLLKPVRAEELIRTLRHAREQIILRRTSEQLQAALASSEQKLRHIFDSVGAGILAIDSQRRIHFANRGITEMLGYSSEELLGCDVVDTLFTSAERAKCRIGLEGVLRGEDLTFEAACTSRDGETRLVQWRWTRVHGDPSDDAAYGVGTDVTVQRDLERRMRAQEKLAAAGTLTAGLAHEIRNPLNAAVLQLSLLSRLLRKLPVQENRRLTEPIDVVRSELKRLDALLEDFLRLARPRVAKASAIDLEMLIGDVVRLEGEAARSKGLKLDAEVESGLFARGDVDPMKQVLVNLINNALEAARSRVSISATSAAEWVDICVRDDGCGIPKESIDRVFEPFFTTKPTGTGLGLPIVYSIVRSFDGDITLESSGEGTLARVRLPRWADVPQQQDDPTTSGG
ncbi:MAG: response regulator [Deltaproteobacteria bacterium]|nr:response regulator [Deltaproteobacteria bacterium]